jgi:VWFA-related protein
MVDRRILAVFLLATGAGLAETRCRAQEPRSRAEIKVESVLVSEPVTVRDAKGRAVSDLRVDNFLVTDNGVPQTILHFEVGGDALSLVLAVETSSRVASLLPKLRKTGVLLTQAVMGPNAEAAVVGFHDDVRKLRDFTTNADAIESTLAHLDGGTSGSKLYDALALGVEMLAGRQRATPAEPGRRRVLLVVAEADDHGSEAKLEGVLRRAQHENITISSVGLSTVHALIGNRASMKPADPGYGDNNLIPVAKWAVTHVRDQLAGSPLEIAASRRAVLSRRCGETAPSKAPSTSLGASYMRNIC